MNTGNTATPRIFRLSVFRLLILFSGMLMIGVVLLTLYLFQSQSAGESNANSPVTGSPGLQTPGGSASLAELPEGLNSLEGIEPHSEWSGSGDTVLEVPEGSSNWVVVWDYSVTGLFSHSITVSTDSGFVWKSDGPGRFLNGRQDNRNFVIVSSTQTSRIDVKSSGVNWDVQIFPLPSGQ